MSRTNLSIFAFAIIALCLSLLPSMGVAQTNPGDCKAFNRNWQCNTSSATPTGPVVICVETVVNGVVVSQQNKVFASNAAFTAYQASAPSGTSYNVCGAGPTCTQTTETRQVACSAGMIGSITQQRTVNVAGQCGQNSAWQETSNTCSTPPANVCTLPWGGTLQNGQSVTAYSTATTANGEACVSQTRTCTNGVLSGSYTFQNCTPGPRICTTPWGQQLNHGQSVTAYYQETVPNGQLCVSETRTCNDGSLSGSYTKQTCNNAPPQSCALPWGGTIAHGASVAAYQSATAAYGQVCVSEIRQCNNGVLSGSYTVQNCSVNPPANCALPWGGTLNHGQSVTAWNVATATGGQICQSQSRTCTNGVLSGSYTFQNCSAVPTCTETTETRSSACPSGQVGTVIEQRTVNVGNQCGVNGSWSVLTSACEPQTCALPWGGTIANGQSVTAYQTSTTPYGQICQSQTRTCSSGVLSGSYTYQNCTTEGPTCDINLAAGNYMNLNVLQLAQQQNCPIVPGVKVTLTILQGATIGSNSYNFPSFTTGTGWPTNVTIKVINYGRIQGAGGDGAYINQTTGVMVPAQPGGVAVEAPYPMVFDNSHGQVWGGGGGGASIGFGHCSPAGGGGAGVIPGETFDPWGNCNEAGAAVAANSSDRISRMGKNTNYLATNVLGADNEYMIRTINGDTGAAYYVSGPGGAPGQAGGNAHYYIRSQFGQPYGTPASTITGYYFYPTFPSNVLNVTGGDAGLAIGTPSTVTFTNTVGDLRGKDYPTNPPRVATPQPPLDPLCTATTETRTSACPSGQQGVITETRTMNLNGQCGATSQWTVSSNTCQTVTCALPWGGTLGNGQSVIAYQSSNGQVCNWESRTCNNGTLSGSYTNQTCTVTPPQSCNLPWGGSIASGQSVTAYQSSGGSSCNGETRVCNNGTLSGSFTNQTCNVTPQTCNLPWGGTIANGQSVTAYRVANLPYNDSCMAGGNWETRTCSNGMLSGSYVNQTCQTANPPAASCTLPNGSTIASGQSVVMYANGTPPEGSYCQGETRTCNNGSLGGSYGNSTCTQVICTTAQAGSAIAKTCTYVTYTNGTQTGSNSTTTTTNSNTNNNNNSNSNSNSNVNYNVNGVSSAFRDSTINPHDFQQQ